MQPKKGDEKMEQKKDGRGAFPSGGMFALLISPHFSDKAVQSAIGESNPLLEKPLDEENILIKYEVEEKKEITKGQIQIFIGQVHFR